MRRVVVWTLLIIVLAATAGPVPRVIAQEEGRQQQKAAEFNRLWQRLQQASEPEERIAVVERALQLESELDRLPLTIPRDEARARMWWWRADSYAQWPRGERSENVERAIENYQQALQVLTHTKSPIDWASLQNNLGLAHSRRIRGERANNIENAIAAYGGALTVRTRNTLPREWAATQNNLGLAYSMRIRGEPADNTEKAIAAYQAALTIFTHQALPLSWATAQDNLGIAYGSRIRGDRADNLEKAIAAHEASLTVRTREALPREWAVTQNNLGLVYMDRIHGDRVDNLEKAIAAYQAALTINTREGTPHSWAIAQNNLAVAYRNRISGERADNMEKAIAAYQAVLSVFTRYSHPTDWATAQNNLGAAYSHRIRGDRADNLEKAIAAHETGLAVRTRESLPQPWADTMNDLGNAHQRRIHGNRTDNLENAIASYHAALTVRTREALPYDWATTQNNIAAVYGVRVRGERADNLKKAIASYEAALSVFTQKEWPREHLRSARLLGGALLETHEWRRARLVLASARDAFLLLLGQGLNDVETRGLVEEAGSLFAEAAFAAAQDREFDEALALASEGRARLLAVAMRLQTLELAAEQRQKLDALRSTIRTVQRTAEVAQGIERTVSIDTLIRLRGELFALVKSAPTHANELRSALSRARELLATGGAIAMPVVTKFGGKILLVTSAGRVQESTILDVPQLSTPRLYSLVRGMGGTGGWLHAYKLTYLQGDEQNRRWPEWLAAVSGLGPQLWELFGAQLDAALKEHGVKRGARLVWLPSGALGILPLGLAQDPVSKRRLADYYEITYAPSLEALASAQRQVAEPGATTLAAIVNPTGDLPGTEKEGRLVASHFPTKARTVLLRAEATPDTVIAALKGKTHWHFASHGTFSWDDARQSALMMHGQERLSVGRLLETDGLGRPRLVVLSACETGLYDISVNPDEFIGLPGTFMALGAAGVLGTLWPVSDAATALLMAKFYELHVGQKVSPPTALSRAQAWLRRASIADLQAYAREAVKHSRLESRHITEIEEELSADGMARSRNNAVVEWVTPDATRTKGGKAADHASRVARPYAHPYFWAGFIYTGL